MPRLSVGGKSLSPKLSAHPVMTNLCHVLSSCFIYVAFGVKNECRAFLAILSPWLHVCHFTAGVWLCTAVCASCSPGHLADVSCESIEHLPGSSSNFTNHLYPWKQRCAITHWESPVCRQSHFLCNSTWEQPVEKYKPFNACFAEPGMCPGCILLPQLCGKRVTWYLHL